MTKITHPILRVVGVSKRFGGVQALKNVDITVGRAEILGLIGPNGSGKTTLVNVVSGILKQDEGKIEFDGKDISHLPAYRRVKLGIARTFQIPRLYWGASVLDNVLAGLVYRSQIKSMEKLTERAIETLRMLNLESKSDFSPRELNLVEMRKLELARALVGGPKLIFLDESFAGLTDAEINHLLSVIKRIYEEEEVTMVIIEHIMKVIMNICTRIVVLNSGIKIAEGTPEEIMNNEEVIRAYIGE